MSPEAEVQHVDQRRRVAGGARELEGAPGVGEPVLRVAKQPPRDRPPGQARRADVLTEQNCKAPVLGGIVEFDRAIEMGSPLFDLPRV